MGPEQKPRGTTISVTATEFRRRCGDILDRLDRGEVERVAITKRGRIVAVVIPPESKREMIKGIWGFMRGSVIIPDEIDLTDPICDEPFASLGERSKPHGW
ncbi:MAG: type II toxin-antitoxin system Phd/YefM family antitoxin [Alphaproteobacteria bacterium]|nr:type II toxin-antitoxin system Phd/YefM family antitoxin [Alphaproteobacteria bacterium]